MKLQKNMYRIMLDRRKEKTGKTLLVKKSQNINKTFQFLFVTSSTFMWFNNMKNFLNFNLKVWLNFFSIQQC